MRVGLEEARGDDHAHVDVHQVLHDVGGVEAGRLERRLVGDLDAADALHDEHALGRQLVVDLGHHYARLAREDLAHAVGAAASRRKSSS